MMVPENHPVFSFPLNLEDRVDYIKEQLEKIKLNILDGLPEEKELEKPIKKNQKYDA